MPTPGSSILFGEEPTNARLIDAAENGPFKIALSPSAMNGEGVPSRSESANGQISSRCERLTRVLSTRKFRVRVRQRGIVVPNTMDEGRLFAWLVEDGIAGEQPFAEFCRQRRFSLSLTTSIRDVP